MPEFGSSAYYLLSSLLQTSGKYRDELCTELGGGFRSPLQLLTGSKLGYWLIHSEQREHEGRKQSFYWVDERHLSCDWAADNEARIIARKRYRDRSYCAMKNSVKGIKRAWKEKLDADRKYQQLTESKKPQSEQPKGT